MLEALELTGPIEGLTSMIESHCATRAPSTTHDLARELLDLGMPSSVLQETMHGARLPLCSDMNTSEVRGPLQACCCWHGFLTVP